MYIELKTGAVRLAPNQTLKLVDGAGSTVCAVEGAVWITEENQPRDIVLKEGGCYQLKHEGVTIVNSLGGEAAVSLTSRLSPLESGACSKTTSSRASASSSRAAEPA